MSANKHLTALAISTALVIGQSALAQEPAGDSAYQWGRWAVLSPASGGEPFSGPDEPGADFNVRPGDLFSPELASSGGSLPPVTLSPPSVVPNPPGALPPIGDGRERPITTTPNPPSTQPPIGDGRRR